MGAAGADPRLRPPSPPPRRRWLGRWTAGAPLIPRSFQARLTLGFLAVVAATLVLVSALVLNRLDEYFAQQTRADLAQRILTVRDYVMSRVWTASDGSPVVDTHNELDPRVRQALADSSFLEFAADRLAQADVRLRLGSAVLVGDREGIVPAPDADFSAPLEAQPAQGQTREDVTVTQVFHLRNAALYPYALEITLSDPYTFRAQAIAAAGDLLVAVGILALGSAVVVAAVLAQRFTIPLRRLTEGARALAEGDLSRRVHHRGFAVGSAEIDELTRQFNAMAERLQQSMEIIRRDRDRSREFLADVSHELRTPIAAIRTFIELLLERAGDDPATRAEFLRSAEEQLERLDWLAQNLLELSRLDSGIALLDLRPDDLRVSVESAVEQARPTADRRRLELSLSLPPEPVRIRHDPQRIGQVVANLVGNALKFTPSGGRVSVRVVPRDDGAQIIVSDTGVGIDPRELPRIFERFYRGTAAGDARSSGSGLGLAIVKSIVDMHHGRIEVESRVGHGSTFTVTLPRDPRRDEVAEGSPSDVSASHPPPHAALAVPTRDQRQRAPSSSPPDPSPVMDSSRRDGHR